MVKLIDYSVDGSFIAIGNFAKWKGLSLSHSEADTSGSTCWSRDADDW